MQAVILAGGKGTRLRPLTYQVPKSMIPINGKPFLQYQLELLKSFGIKRFLFLVGYLGNQIESYFENGTKFGIDLEYSYEDKLLGTGGALKNAEQKLSDVFLLLNGDTFLLINYTEFIDSFLSYNKTGMMSIYTNRQNIFTNNILVDKSNFVIEYNKKKTSDMLYVDAGAIIFRKEILGYIPSGQTCSLEEQIFFQLIQRKELVAYLVKQRFYDIGSFEELKNIEDVLL